MLVEAWDFVMALKQHVPFEIKEYYWATMHVWKSPALWGVLALLLAWQRLQPADPRQPLFAGGMGQDFLWFHLDIAVNVALLPAVAGVMRLLYDRVTGGAVLDVTAGWPDAVKIVVAVLAVDVLFYVKHRTMHRVETLWHFHVIHHSQREMNLLTDRRQHLVEHLLVQVFVFLPLIAFGLKPLAVMTVGAFLWWHTLFIHANIRTNLGVLGTVVVSPQFHRVHHSIDPRHHDRNFGSFITLWDRVFGTMYHGVDEYPATGVHGVEFPPPKSLKPQAWLADVGRQMWYPFHMIHQRIRGRGMARAKRNAASRASARSGSRTRARARG